MNPASQTQPMDGRNATQPVRFGTERFARNVWYAVAFSGEVTKDSPIQAWVIGEPLVLFRRPGGEVVVFEDRCCHRGAPLSSGRIEGDSIRCMYHGLRFACSGQCIEIPGQDRIPPGMAIRAFPAHEDAGWIWVWMGAADRADTALVPPVVGTTSPGWVVDGGAMDYEANYQLVNDNLCDFSHLSFVHVNSFGGGNEAQYRGHASSPATIVRVERGIRVSRWLLNRPIPPFMAGEVQGEGVDSFLTYDYLLPGVLLMRTSMYAAGAAAAAQAGLPIGEPLHENFTSQTVTPLDHQRTRYRFTWGPRTDHAKPGLASSMLDLALKAFREDKQLLEGQQQIRDASPGFRPRGIVHDKGLDLFRATLAKQMADEAADGPVGS